MGDPSCVAFDLETTGLDPDHDVIIEIGAVRFDRGGVRDRFQTLVNPRRSLNPAIVSLTGIRDEELRSAPSLSVVARDFERFIEGAVLVGQNAVAFDAVFLDKAGIRHNSDVYDTAELSAVLLPGLADYSLAGLTSHFSIDFPVRHRALEDAEAAMRVFLELRRAAVALPAGLLGQVAQWLTPTAWPWRAFFREAWEEAARVQGGRPAPRLRAPSVRKPLSPRREPQPSPADCALSVLASAQERPDLFEDFDDRAEQRAMVEAVATALNEERKLIIEAGTGIGKSLAYLIPAACYALANERRVVVSTATINLQDQLIRKDIPAVEALLGKKDGPSDRPEDALRACQLKGRRNYLCLRRFEALRAAPSLSDAEALLASKVLVWLTQTETGDRAELRLSQAEESVWWRLSADGSDCNSDNSPFVVDGSCFLQRARQQAEASHIVVVNHSLLLSDIAAAGRVLPPYEHLVIDEAHHLEDEASRQFGFECSERDLLDALDACESLAPEVQKSLRGFALVPRVGSELLDSARALRQLASGARPRVREFADRAKAFMREHAPSENGEPRLHINRSMRVQPDWGEVEIAWENLKLALRSLCPRLEEMQQALSAPECSSLLNAELITARTRSLAQTVEETLAGMEQAIEEDTPATPGASAQRVVWFECAASGELTVAWAPLAVEDLLKEMLYAGRRSVVLTGATLRTQGAASRGRGSGFAYIQGRLGLEDADTVALGSPFDYERAAMALLPSDMPEPSSPAYQDHLSRAIIDLVRASGGRALALFTSYASLFATHRAVAPALSDDGILVLGQGIDGSPRQLVRALKSNPRTLLLGTASFWEGVDIPGEALSLLIMARLPFAVPTDPVFAARSALYDDPFSQYGLPQAVLRFKQGFGRLIRTKTDRGVLVVLDRRIASKQYGSEFLQSLPPCSRRVVPLRQMPSLLKMWLDSSIPE